MKIYWQMGGYGRPEQSPGASHSHTNNMTNQELIKQIDDLQYRNEISFEQWWAMKKAVIRLLPDEVKAEYPEAGKECKECEAKALLSACRAARLAYYRAEHSTPERASALGKVQEAEGAADRFLEGYTETEESCKGCMGPCGVCEDTKQSKGAILRGMFGYTDRGMGVTPRWEWTVQGGAEAYMKALEDRVRQLEFEREEVRKMRTVQKKFFRSPQGSAAKVAALEESRRLERWVDTALEPEKPTAATLFG